VSRAECLRRGESSLVRFLGWFGEQYRTEEAGCVRLYLESEATIVQTGLAPTHFASVFLLFFIKFLKI
jgi:hypothetical protein